jgi:hypothetical protein
MDEEKQKNKIEMLLEEHGWKLDVPPSALPSDDRAPLGGGLRCFGKVYNRDDFGNKIRTQPRRRCNNPCFKGSFFCKKCGGGNANALIHGRRSGVSSLYRSAFQADLGTMFEVFINDPTIMDLKPELAALRVCLKNYIDELNKKTNIRNVRKLNKSIRVILNDSILSDEEKFINIKDICARNSSISDGESIDRIAHVCEVISRVTERMNKVQSSDKFMLTLDGIKILYRCIIDAIRECAPVEIQKKLKEQLMSIRIRTSGDLNKYVDVVKNVEVKEVNEIKKD